MKFDELRGALLEVPLPIRELNPLEPAEELPLPDDRLVPWRCGENERIEFALPPADLPPDDLLPEDLLPEEIPPRRLLPLPGELCAEPPLRNLLLPPPFPLRDPPLLLFPPRLLFGAALDHSAVSKNMASIAAQSPNLARMGVSPSPK